MTPSFAAVFAALCAMPLASYAPGLDPETETTRLPRFRTLASAIVVAAERATCTDQGEGCVRTWPGGPDEAEAMLLMLGRYESHWVYRVHAGHCWDNECDSFKLAGGHVGHRATSPWQVQASRVVPYPLWRTLAGTDLAATTRAAAAALAVLSSARLRCAHAGAWETGAVSGYATGRLCHWRGATGRVAFYRKTLLALRDYADSPAPVASR